jgi:hypothetical protein
VSLGDLSHNDYDTMTSRRRFGRPGAVAIEGVGIFASDPPTITEVETSRDMHAFTSNTTPDGEEVVGAVVCDRRCPCQTVIEVD